MKKFLLLSITSIMMMLAMSASAVTTIGENSRMMNWLSSENEVILNYTAAYPLTAGDENADAINAYFTYLLDDAEAFTVPIYGEILQKDETHGCITVTSSVTCNNDVFYSILSVTETKLDDDAYQVYAGYTFALTGEKTGCAVSLPRVLGILNDTSNDTWLEERQTEKASVAVRSLVWNELLQRDDLMEWVDEEVLAMSFFPEQDFYLNEDGNLVFFLQPGTVTDESAGVLLFVFSVDDVLDEL